MDIGLVVATAVIEPGMAHGMCDSLDRRLDRYTIAVDNSQDGFRRDDISVYRPPPQRIRLHPRNNIGMARAFNLAARSAHDWLIWLSPAMRFTDGGASLLEACAECPDGWISQDAGWHCVGFPRHTLDRVGPMDENAFPAYVEDTDMRRRLHLAYVDDGPTPADRWPLPTYPIKGDRVRDGHGHDELIRLNPKRRTINIDALHAYYRSKWGGDPFQETYTHPFGDRMNGLDYWPRRSIPELERRYRLGVRG